LVVVVVVLLLLLLLLLLRLLWLSSRPSQGPAVVQRVSRRCRRVLAYADSCGLSEGRGGGEEEV